VFLELKWCFDVAFDGPFFLPFKIALDNGPPDFPMFTMSSFAPPPIDDSPRLDEGPGAPRLGWRGVRLLLQPRLSVARSAASSRFHNGI